MRKTILALLMVVCIMSASIAFAENWVCPGCGRENAGNFCPDCGTERPNWVCPVCGTKNYSAFCENCGAARPAADVPQDVDEVDELRETVSELNRMIENGEMTVPELMEMLQLTGYEQVRFDGASMNDTIEDGEVTSVSMMNYGSIWFCRSDATANEVQEAPRLTYGTPGMLDVVLCRYPARGNVVFIKRITGLPGDTVELLEGFLYVNGEQVETDKDLINPEYRASYGHSFGPYYVPKKGDKLVITVDANNNATYWVNGTVWARKMTCVVAKDKDGNHVKLYNRKVDAQSRSAQMEDTEVVVFYKGQIWHAQDVAGKCPELVGQELTIDEDYYFIMGDHRNNSNDSRSIGVLERSAILGRVEKVIFPLNKGRDIQ